MAQKRTNQTCGTPPPWGLCHLDLGGATSRAALPILRPHGVKSCLQSASRCLTKPSSQVAILQHWEPLLEHCPKIDAIDNLPTSVGKMSLLVGPGRLVGTSGTSFKTPAFLQRQLNEEILKGAHPASVATAMLRMRSWGGGRTRGRVDACCSRRDNMVLWSQSKIHCWTMNTSFSMDDLSLSVLPNMSPPIFKIIDEVLEWTRTPEFGEVKDLQQSSGHPNLSCRFRGGPSEWHHREAPSSA